MTRHYDKPVRSNAIERTSIGDLFQATLPDIVDFIGKSGRRERTRTSAPHHVKVAAIGLQAAPVLDSGFTMTL